jgi:hypothetical protein
MGLKDLQSMNQTTFLHFILISTSVLNVVTSIMGDCFNVCEDRSAVDFSCINSAATLNCANLAGISLPKVYPMVSDLETSILWGNMSIHMNISFVGDAVHVVNQLLPTTFTGGLEICLESFTIFSSPHCTRIDSFQDTLVIFRFDTSAQYFLNGDKAVPDYTHLLHGWIRYRPTVEDESIDGLSDNCRAQYAQDEFAFKWPGSDIYIPVALAKYYTVAHENGSSSSGSESVHLLSVEDVGTLTISKPMCLILSIGYEEGGTQAYVDDVNSRSDSVSCSTTANRGLRIKETHFIATLLYPYAEAVQRTVTDYCTLRRFTHLSCARFMAQISAHAYKLLLARRANLPDIQYMPTPQQPFVFLHIEKTAGTTIRE